MTDYKRPNSDNYFEIQAELGFPFLGKELDTELTDAKNQRIALKQAIDNTAAGNIPGSSDPINENKVLKTNGAGQVSWVFADEQQIGEQGVATRNYRDQSITTAKYQDLSVTTEKINHNAVTTAKVADGNVTMSKLADASVTTTKVMNASITAPKIAANAVGTANIIDGNVTTTKIANASVTYEKLGANVVLELMKAIYPIGAVYITYLANQTPPLQNAGITWTAIAAGKAIETASLQNNGQTAGAQALVGGTTNGHALTIGQLAPHTHTYTRVVWHKGGRHAEYVGTITQNQNAQTSSTGNGEQHSHGLNIANQKLLFWRRTA